MWHNKSMTGVPLEELGITEAMFLADASLGDPPSNGFHDMTGLSGISNSPGLNEDYHNNMQLSL